VFSSTILDVAAGVIFGFLAVSLFTSAAVEAINSLFGLRARNLKTGIMALVNDPNFSGLAKQLYEHALISPLGPGPGSANPLKRAPAYIDKLQFAGALLDITGLSTNATPAAGATVPEAIAALKVQVNAIADPQIRQLLQGLVNRSAGDIDRIKTQLADWFDNAMDRLSGAFRRLTQVLTFIIALLFAVAVNLDSIKVATLLWEQPALAEKLKWPALDTKITADAKTEEDAIREVTNLMEAGLPIGWAKDHFLDVTDNQGVWQPIWEASSSVWSRSLLGWIITAIAALFGAPFWFDTLQSVVRLKGTGPSPNEKAQGRAAAS
jgi:hypothetical protein